MLTSIQWSCFNSLKFRQSWYFRLIFHFFSCFLQPISKFDQQLFTISVPPIWQNNNSKSKRLLIKVKNAFLRLKDWKESYCMIFFIDNGRKRKWRKILCLIVDCRQIFVNQFCLQFDHILPIPSWFLLHKQKTLQHNTTKSSKFFW